MISEIEIKLRRKKLELWKRIQERYKFVYCKSDYLNAYYDNRRYWSYYIPMKIEDFFRGLKLFDIWNSRRRKKLWG